MSWIDRDDYGFFSDLGSEAVKIPDRAGLTAFETEVHVRFEKACGNQGDQSDSHSAGPWARTLRSIYAQQGSAEKYIVITERTGLTPGDCMAVAHIMETKRKLDDALLWVERGIAIRDTRKFYSDGGHELARMRRTLLKKLGRRSEAMESAWSDFEKSSGVSGYEELMCYVSKPDRAIWQEKALASAERGNLGPFIELCVKTKELDRLAKHLEYTGDRKIEDLSHYVTEPAAAPLAKAHPAAAAKVFRALCVRILKAAKSKYYDAALAHLREARRCYLAAGLEQQWEVLALEIRRDHSRKSSFMPGFNAIIAGKGARVEPLFLDGARWRWESKAKP